MMMKFRLLSFLSSRSQSQSPHSYAFKSLFSSGRPVISKNGRDLYKEISKIGASKISVVPVLDKWIEEGKPARREELMFVIKQLNFDKRFNHGLEVSQWMTDKRFIALSTEDVSLRLKFIYNVHGLEAAEKYFENIHQQHKNILVLNSLLSCYCHSKSIDKAECLMQEIRDLGYNNSSYCYATLMRMYSQLEDYEKLDVLVQEMEQKNIVPNKFTYTIQLKAYADAEDSDRMDKIVKKMESDPRVATDTEVYSIAASLYERKGLHEKALEMLEKLEEITPKTLKSKSYDHMIDLYGRMGKKDDVFRIWNLYKKEDRILNKGYLRMIKTLVSLGESEEVVKMVKEWELKTTSYDFRVTNFLIEVYCKRGEIEKAEDGLNNGIAKGSIPSCDTWLILAGAYVKDNQFGKMMEALKNAKSVCPKDWKSSKNMIVKCLEIFGKEKDIERAETKDLIELVKLEGFRDPKVVVKMLDSVTAA